MVTSSTLAPKPAFEPKVAVARFLADMATVAERTFPAWHETLTEGIAECPLSVDARRAVLDVHPLDDYYLAGVVALEASKIRQLFAPDDAAELLSEIGEQVDAVSKRGDRVVSDLVFFIIGRVEMAMKVDEQKKPYDEVVKAILQRLGIDKVEATQHLIDEVLYRHTLGEPLALGVPHWWHTYHAKYSLTPKEAAPITVDGIPVPQAPPPAASSARRKARRSAVAF